MKKLRSPWAKFCLLAIFFGLLIMTKPVHAADAKTQQTTAEQDYDRGYDDGYQAYEDDKIDRKELGEYRGEKEF